ncbi:hypothetical protein PhCBS80983_g04379 [Powellomyces hirtus]|uniref:RING-type domain-containing protein n=1 Tax=Powellomyces hirtus TaxID=109895 RepID=A0A507E0S2_9FUNG|nr:hypothetical protein PhCBS80983_g04379 [Powellomyces hirtus]
MPGSTDEHRATPSSTSATDSASTCRICNKEPTSYAPTSCGHATLCRACAMKQATGGKCRECGEMFMEVRRVD